MAKNKAIKVILENAAIERGGKTIIKGMNFTLQEGELVYIVGDPGSGKTTFLEALCGDVPLTAGGGQISGFDLKSMNRIKQPYLKRSLGIVLQDSQFQRNRSVFQHLQMVLLYTGWRDRSLMQEKITDSLEKVGLLDQMHQLPHELSDGQLRRIDIARALLNSPRGLIADDPTANLDSQTSDDIMSLLLNICREYGMYAIMTTYDYFLIHRFPSRICKIENQQLIEYTSAALHK